MDNKKSILIKITEEEKKKLELVCKANYITKTAFIKMLINNEYNKKKYDKYKKEALL